MYTAHVTNHFSPFKKREYSIFNSKTYFNLGLSQLVSMYGISSNSGRSIAGALDGLLEVAC